MSDRPTVIIDGITYVPAPPTEQALPPTPVKRWVVGYIGSVHGLIWRVEGADERSITEDDATAAADALNTLDRDGVAWGPGRPMSELPETGRVLVRMRSGGVTIMWADDIRSDRPDWYLGWWPLPLPGEAQ